jgi:hypothetical protein
MSDPASSPGATLTKAVVTAGVVLAILACVFAVSCGGNAASQGSSVAVGKATDVKFGDSEVWTLPLTATGKPGGTISLVAVHDGTVKTFNTLPFRDMTAGSVSVLVSPHGIEAAISAGAGATTDAIGFGPFAFVKGSRLDSTSWGGGSVDFNARGEVVLWDQDRIVAPQPSLETSHADKLADVVSASLAHPRVTSYCIAVMVVTR